MISSSFMWFHNGPDNPLLAAEKSRKLICFISHLLSWWCKWNLFPRMLRFVSDFLVSLHSLSAVLFCLHFPSPPFRDQFKYLDTPISTHIRNKKRNLSCSNRHSQYRNGRLPNFSEEDLSLLSSLQQSSHEARNHSLWTQLLQVVHPGLLGQWREEQPSLHLSWMSLHFFLTTSADRQHNAGWAGERHRGEDGCREETVELHRNWDIRRDWE